MVDNFLNKITEGDCLKLLQQLPDNSIDCNVSSPPYWAVRDYKIEPTQWPAVTYSIMGMEIHIPAMTCALGLEPNPKAFTGHMVLIYRQIFRVLKPWGTAWMNLGDSYASGKRDRTFQQACAKSTLASTLTQQQSLSQQNKIDDFLKRKDMAGIPWMVAFALRDDGWYLRQDIIWSKPNPMPESVSDRCTKAHEYIFLLSKSPEYYYDAEAIKTVAKTDASETKYAWSRAIDASITDNRAGNGENIRKEKKRGHVKPHQGFNETWDKMTREQQGVNGANKRSVWSVATTAFPEAHFATFPPDLIIDCIKAGTSEHGCCDQCGKPYIRQVDKKLVPTHKAPKNFVIDHRDLNADIQDHGSNRQKDGHKSGHIYNSKTIGWNPSCDCTGWIIPSVVLDHFAGSGTTPEVARKLNRNFIGFELNAEYIKIAERRLYNNLGMFQ